MSVMLGGLEAAVTGLPDLCAARLAHPAVDLAGPVPACRQCEPFGLTERGGQVGAEDDGLGAQLRGLSDPMPKMTPGQEAAYALDFDVSRGSLLLGTARRLPGRGLLLVPYRGGSAAQVTRVSERVYRTSCQRVTGLPRCQRGDRNHVGWGD
jgi:hypothetical protein